MSEDRPSGYSGQGVLDDDPWHGPLRYTHLFGIGDVPAPPKLVGPFGSPDGLTILFGDGGSGKSIIVETLMLSVAANADLVAGMVPTVSGPVGWLDFEGKCRQTRHRAGRLVGESAPFFYIPCAGAMWDEVERIKSIAETEGLVLLAVDSVGYAMGSRFSAKDDEAARFFTMAIQDIGLPAFGIAHVPKDSSDQAKPFGSAFWHNGASQTWAVDKIAKAGHIVRLTNRKDNDGDLALPVVFEISWDERIVVCSSKAAPPDDELVLAVETIGPASTAAVLEWLTARGWLISAGMLTDHLARLERAGRLRRAGKTRNTRWEPIPKASSDTPNDREAGARHPPNATPNRSRGEDSRAAGGAE